MIGSLRCPLGMANLHCPSCAASLQISSRGGIGNKGGCFMPYPANTSGSSDALPCRVFPECEARIDALPAPSLLPSTLDLLHQSPDRRLFLKTLAFPCAAACAMALTRNCLSLPIGTWGTPVEDDSRYRVEARFYEKLSDKTVRCKLCPRECVVAQGSRGYCRVRENR